MVEAAPLGSAVARVNSLAKEQSEWTVVLKKQEVMVRRKKNEGGRVMKNEGTKDRELERIMGREERWREEEERVAVVPRGTNAMFPKKERHTLGLFAHQKIISFSFVSNPTRSNNIHNLIGRFRSEMKLQGFLHGTCT